MLLAHPFTSERQLGKDGLCSPTLVLQELHPAEGLPVVPARLHVKRLATEKSLLAVQAVMEPTAYLSTMLTYFLASNCVGDIEGDPTCADSAWSLWKGSYGNGFCCEVGMIGAYYNGESVAGKCVTSVPSGYTSAQLVGFKVVECHDTASNDHAGHSRNWFSIYSNYNTFFTNDYPLVPKVNDR